MPNRTDSKSPGPTEIDDAFDAMVEGYELHLIETYGDFRTNKLDFERLRREGGESYAADLLVARSARRIEQHSRILIGLTIDLVWLTRALIAASIVLAVLTAALVFHLG